MVFPPGADVSAADTTESSSLEAAPWNYRLLAAISRRYPFCSGSSRLVQSRIFEGLVKPEHALAWCYGPGGSMAVPLDDFVGRCIYFTGDYDRKVSLLCRRIVKPGDSVLDIGANMGVVTLQLARLVGPTGTVHAFEPNPRMATLITRSATKNRFDNIRLHPTALGSSTGTLELHVPRDNAGQGSFIYHKDVSTCDVVQTPVRRLSDIAREEGISELRFIKIDVEGFENQVLVGAQDILEKVRPDVILFEANETLPVSFSCVPAVKTLQQAGYRFMALPKSMLTLLVTPIDINQHAHSPSHDILAIPEEKYGQIAQQLMAGGGADRRDRSQEIASSAFQMMQSTLSV
jgi:FkbM family methyltransferase